MSSVGSEMIASRAMPSKLCGAVHATSLYWLFAETATRTRVGVIPDEFPQGPGTLGNDSSAVSVVSATASKVHVVGAKADCGVCLVQVAVGYRQPMD